MITDLATVSCSALLSWCSLSGASPSSCPSGLLARHRIAGQQPAPLEHASLNCSCRAEQARSGRPLGPQAQAVQPAHQEVW